MAIAGALVVPFNKDCVHGLKERLSELTSVEVKEVGPKGIAIVLEEKDTHRLKKVSEQIQAWQEVVDFQLAYLNWEELEGENTD